MIIKQPSSYDVSHHKEIFDFKLVNPKPDLFITKATEAIPGGIYIHTDTKFLRFASGMAEIGVIRGFFHFFRKNYSGHKQGEHFVNVISKIDILPSDILILDIEDGDMKYSVSNLWAWHEEVKKAYPHNLRINYGNKYGLNPIIMTEAEKDYFRQIPTWISGYPLLPDLYSSMPKGYEHDKTKFGEPVMWQYSAHGRVEGITTELGKPTDADLNLLTKEFHESIKDSLVIGETTMEKFTGECKSLAKTWEQPGGKNLNYDIKAGSYVEGDAERDVSGVAYIHLTSPIVGWSKKQWFSIKYDTTTPDPDPEPEPDPVVTKTHEIEIFDDGSIKVDGNAIP